MKVVHLSTDDALGGAARAAYRLHRSLLAGGVDGTMVVLNKASDDATVIRVPRSTLAKAAAKIAPYLEQWPVRRRPPGAGYWSPAWFGLFPTTRLPQVRDADVIALYWVCGGFLSPAEIGRLLRLGKPVVWRLSDMWAFTGGCHFAGSCSAYERHCGRCPQLHRSHRLDLSHWGWRRKAQSWRRAPLAVVAPSRWLADCARRSSLFGARDVRVIPTGVPIDTYKPMPKAFARQVLGLPAERALILFGAGGAATDARKGFSYMAEGLARFAGLYPQIDADLVVFGTSRPVQIPGWRGGIHVKGYLSDETSMALLYAACDVFVAPSLEDNLPNTVLEASACGTPCVAFAAGGIVDAVDHERDGFLARPRDAESLARGIGWVLESPERRQRLALAVREKTVQSFSLERQAAAYRALYEELLHAGRSNA